MRSGAHGPAFIYASVVLLVMGSAIPIPLLPLYKTRLDLEPSQIALLFGCYLAAMVVALGLGSIPATQSRPRATLLAALGLSLATDLLFIVETEQALLAARALTGISVGFGLGAGATLAVTVRGEQWRSIAATMPMVAGLVGVPGSALLADHTPWPTVAPYVLHAALLCIVLAGLIRATLIPQSKATPPVHHAMGTSQHLIRYSARQVWNGAALGALAWSLGNVVVGLGPTLVLDSLDAQTLLGASMVAVMVTGFGVVGQYAVPRTRIGLATVLAVLCLLFGALLLALGASTSNVWGILTGGALVGMGQGAGYRTGMVAVTRGLHAQHHGARTSLYACAAYVCAATAVQVGGLLMTAHGNTQGLVILLTAAQLPIIAVLVSALAGSGRHRRMDQA